MKLLLVEDEVLLSKNIAKGLRLSGYAVDCAADGEEALALYELNEYDLMILDLNLPKISGLEILRRIRKTDADFRILILSARNTLEDKISGLDQGSNDYLTKPFDFRELEARIRGLLRRNFTTAAGYCNAAVCVWIPLPGRLPAVKRISDCHARNMLCLNI